MKQSILGIMTFLLLLAALAIPEARSDSGFGYRMKITVNSSQVSNGPQTSFPFLFSTTNADTTTVKNKLRTTGNGGHVTNANGFDIIFRALDDTTCGGAGTAPCTLNHEIEKYDATTGEFVAWVKVPSINTGTVLYVYYGNASVTTSQEHKTAVWDTNYKGVWHLPVGRQTFGTAGSSSFTVPAGVTSVTVKAWGGGGGGADSGAYGGGGGFAQGTITVTPGTTLTVYVGGGGTVGTYTVGGAGGGGYSAVTNGSTYLVQAGGGGGAAPDLSGPVGGAGGGSSGAAGTTGYYGGTGGGGGTTIGGGAKGTGGGNGTDGSANQGGLGGYYNVNGDPPSAGSPGGGPAGGANGGGAGGQGANSGGGGGGGRFGGGGGGASNSTGGGGGGGGGSSLVTASATGVVQTAGSGTTPGNNTDSDYTGTVGVGGATTANGHAGYVVISWGANDSTNASTATNHAATATTGAANLDGAANFVSASSQYIDSGLRWSSSDTTQTVSFWLKTSSASTNVIGNYDGAAYGPYIYVSSHQLYASVRDNGLHTIGANSSATVDDNAWHYGVVVISGTTLKVYVDGGSLGSGTNASFNGNMDSGTNIGFGTITLDSYYFPAFLNGSLDEIRISKIDRSATAGWIATEFNNQSAPGSFYALAAEESNPPTIITLSSFSVSPAADGVHIDWQTKSEVDNLGFNLYRTAPDGTGAVKLNGSLIPGLVSAASGKDYTYTDTAIRGGTTICYMLEDIDLHQQSTYHGPACAYWPAEGSSASSQGTTSYLPGAGSASLAAGGGSSSTSSGSSQQALPGILPVSTGPVTQVTMRSLSAVIGPQGVLIQWQTGLEVRNLGFHVYREDGGRRIRINHELLLGSALIAGTHTILRSGHAYSYFDPGASGGTYWIEDVDLSGQRMLHGPVVAAPGVLPEKKATVRPRIPPRMRRLLANADFPGGNTPLATQWALAGIPSLKLLIKTEGIYRVSFRELADAGFDVRRPAALQLYVDGKEEPLAVTPTGIIFYATGVDTPFTDTRIYWLVNGLTPGKRIQQTGGIGTQGPVSFPATVTLKPRSFYFPALLNGDASNFFGNLIYQSGTTLTFSASHSTQGDAALDVRLQGVTTGHHTIQVTLNGSVVGNVVFDGQTATDARFPLAHSQLREGANELGLSASGEEDIAAVDTIHLTYSRTYAAEGASLRFSAPGGSSIILTGVTAPVAIFDVTDTVTQLITQPQREGLRIRVPGKGTRTLYAVTDQGFLTPELSANIPTRWHNQRADLVIITHEDFKDSLAPLVHQRQRQGLSVAVVDIEDLYDEFSYGQKSPLAIKAFLARTRPHYVLLVGGATYDPRNYLGRGGLDFVPTKLIDTALLETASDDWFVDLDGNGVPDIPIGRLPVTTLQEATNALSKILAYEQAPPSPKALYVSDIDDTDDTFEETLRPMEFLTSFVPEELFRAHLGATTGDVLRTRITEGTGLVTYLGHGSLQLWNGDIIDTDTTLTNTAYPFVLAMTCLNGYFISPGIDSLASALVTDTAGAVGMIASSSLTQFAPQAVLGSTILTNLAAGVPVGEALIRAKHAVADPDVQRSYILFGDPSMKVRR